VLDVITRVESEDGEVLHDCGLLGCEVAWDGVDRKSRKKVEGAPADLPEKVKVKGEVATLEGVKVKS
jgi:hypothetical protein